MTPSLHGGPQVSGEWILLAAIPVGVVALWLLGGFWQWWSLHPWRVGIRAARRKGRRP